MNFKQQLATDLTKQFELQPHLCGIILKEEMLETPTDSSLGDIALPCFQFAKSMRKAPQMIANDLLAALKKPDYISEIRIVGGYINFFLDKNNFAKSVTDEIFAQSPIFPQKDETIIVEYSSPNIAKPFHIGHLCSTVIGDSLARLYAELGYKVIRINYLGDYGTQFGKLISAYKHWGNEENLKTNPFDELFRIYVKFHEEAENNPALIDEGRMYFKRLEEKCPEEIALWQRFKDFSMEKFHNIYARLGATFDSYDGESFSSEKTDVVIDMLHKKSLLIKSEGAMVVDLSEEAMPPCLVLKADGATIYATRDIAAAVYRKQRYNFKKMLYVVGIPQALHFKQIFAVLGKMGCEWSKNCFHVGFAHVKFADGKMSTRTGKVVLLDDVLDEAVKRSREKINQTHIDPDCINETAEIIGIGAIKYAFLRAGREKDITFSWDETLDFNGNSGPYVQYSYARAKSILTRAGFLSPSPIVITSNEEFELIKSLAQYKDVLIEASDRNEPSVITRYAYSLAKTFSRFYNACEVIGSQYADSRVCLVYAYSLVIKKVLNLLGVDAPEKM